MPDFESAPLLQLPEVNEHLMAQKADLDDHFKGILATLSPKQQACLELYKGMAYKNLNGFMREGQVQGLSDDELDDLYDTKATILGVFDARDAVLPIHLTVYRGLKKGYPDKNLKVGGILSDYAFTSVSLCPLTARRISLWDTECDSSTFMEISLPAGTPALWIEPLWDKGEYEILLPPPTVLHVSGINPISTEPLRRLVQCQRVQRPRT